MRVSARCKLQLLGAALLAVLLAGCPLRPRAPAAPPVAAAETPAPHTGVPYDIVADESLLTIRVYRGGTLASAGHNHLIASHALTGTIYVPADVARTSFEVHIPVAAFTVDEAALRAQEHSADFPPEVPDAAREGTRRNMLGEALLDSERNPQIVLRALRLESAGQPAASTGSEVGSEVGSETGGEAGGEARAVLARVQTTVRGAVRTISVPVRYQFAAGALIASGEAPLRQSDIGLTPFSALLGALQVQDEMRVRFRIVARAADSRSGAPP
jgi:YceI-like domain